MIFSKDGHFINEISFDDSALKVRKSSSIAEDSEV
jgi:hypothetical protein